jgi:Flp pilus assembly protein TadG
MEPHRRPRDARRGPGPWVRPAAHEESTRTDADRRASPPDHPAYEERPDLMRIAALRRPISRRDRASTRARGQSLVEFALVLVPLFLLILGVVQFGLIFNSYVTMTNATREGARTGTIFIYDRTLSKAQNDTARNTAIRTSVLNSMNLLTKTGPQFAGGSTWTASGTTFTNGDMTITYAVSAGVTESDARTGQTVTVRATYHQDLIIPMISALLPRDANGRLGLPGEVTMVIN